MPLPCQRISLNPTARCNGTAQLWCVPARRTRHVRFNDLKDPEPIPRGTEFSSIIRSDVPIVAQHTRLDSRQAENALLSTVAYPSRAETSV